MMNANRGYSGWSMSNRAVEAYENGEMPKSKWTKKAMLDEIAAYYADNGVTLGDEAGAYLTKLTKTELFDRFFYQSSWHHTSKFFNRTDFYALDEDEADEFAERPTRRVYRVRWYLGRHTATAPKDFRTRAQAERHITERGFRQLGRAFFRGAFDARVTTEYVEI